MVEKAVLDTSVIISGLVGSGSSNEVLRRVLTGRLRIILSAEIFKEYLKAVHYPRLRIPSLYAYAVLSRIHALSEMVSPQSRIRICRDPEDDKFLEDAVEACRRREALSIIFKLIDGCHRKSRRLTEKHRASLHRALERLEARGLIERIVDLRSEEVDGEPRWVAYTGDGRTRYIALTQEGIKAARALFG